MLINTVARDVPGGKRILIIKINAQHNALSKAIKTRFKIEIIYYLCLKLRRNVTINNFYFKSCFYGFTQSIMLGIDLYNKNMLINVFL